VTIETDLPFDTRSVAEGRRLVAASLQAEGIDPALGDDLVLATAELLGNAVRHGRPRADGTIGLTLAVGPDAVAVTVADGGTGEPFPAASDDPAAAQASVPATPLNPAVGGYGLLIVKALGDLQVDRGAEGTRVSVRMDRSQSAGIAGTGGLLSLR
jgi:anti-sigma regulatory factor (Ser/Thr protein kinase)